MKKIVYNFLILLVCLTLLVSFFVIDFVLIKFGYRGIPTGVYIKGRYIVYPDQKLIMKNISKKLHMIYLKKNFPSKYHLKIEFLKFDLG